MMGRISLTTYREAVCGIVLAAAATSLSLVSQPVRAQEQPPPSVAAVAYALSQLPPEPFPLPTWQYELAQIGTQAFSSSPGPTTSGETCILGCAGQYYVQAPPYVLVMDFDAPQLKVDVNLYTQLLGTAFVDAFNSHGVLVAECQGDDVLVGVPSCTQSYPGYPINQAQYFQLSFSRPEIASIVAGCYTAACSVGSITHGTPEPGTLTLLGAGLVTLLAFRRRQGLPARSGLRAKCISD
jgi:hypothetical protein